GRMVDPMHARSDEHTTGPRFDGGWDARVGVLEDRQAAGEPLVEDDRERRDAEERDAGEFCHVRYHCLDWVETKRRGVVDVEVGVVHAVNGPEHWHDVQETML